MSSAGERWTVSEGDARTLAATVDPASVRCVVTSPPYFGMRAYTENDAREIGREDDVEAYVAALVACFDELRPALAGDAALWVNIGDAYLPDGNLAGAPARFALAMQAAGWVWRSEVVWHKKSVIPEGSAKDRPHRDHEPVFLFASGRRYAFDAAAVRQPNSSLKQLRHNQRYAREYDAHAATVAAGRAQPGNENNTGIHSRPGAPGRSLRTVWSLSAERAYGGHPAAFPLELASRCIRASSAPGDLVLDPFCGSGTTGEAALRLGRRFHGFELHPPNATLARTRLAGVDVALPSRALSDFAEGLS